MARKRVLAAVAAACLVSGARADGPTLNVGAAASLFDPSSTAALSGGLRGVLLDALPDPLAEDHSHWGGQRLVAHGLVWHDHGLHLHPEVTKTLRNDGRWWKIKATADHLPDTLVVDLRDLRQPEPGKTTFNLFVSFDTRVEYEHQNWDRGLRLNSGSVEARMRVKLTLACEATFKVESNGKLLPDAVFRLHVTDAHLGYDNFEVEHVLGVGGDLAKLIGDAAKTGVDQWRPSLERKLLEKADAAIIKAGDTKEIRLSVGKLLKGD